MDVVVTGHHLNEKVENHGHVGAIDPWMFHFTVRDTGEGIPEEKLHRLFRAFSQVDASTSRKHGGTGLGLAICHRLCEMLGGAIWLESEPGVGLEFRIYDQGRGRAKFHRSSRALMRRRRSPSLYRRPARMEPWQPTGRTAQTGLNGPNGSNGSHVAHESASHPRWKRLPQVRITARCES